MGSGKRVRKRDLRKGVIVYRCKLTVWAMFCNE